MVNVDDIAYTAGYIDGDGCLYLGKYNSHKGTVYEYSIQVCSVNKEITDWLKKTFGGATRKKEAKGNRKIPYVWTIKNEEAIEFAEQLRGFLKAKYHEMQWWIEFAFDVSMSDYLPVSKEGADHRKKIIKNIRALKHELNIVEHKFIQKIKNIVPTVIPEGYDYPYMAGLIDAEGCFRIKKWLPKNKPNYVYTISLEIGNTNRLFFQWLTERFGGSLTFIKSKKKNRKDSCTWSLQSKRLNNLLPSLIYFLKYKKPVCAKLIEFYKTNLPNGGDRHSESFKRRYKEIITHREQIIKEIHILNAKGNRSS